MTKKILNISMIISTIVFIIAMIALPVRISNKEKLNEYNQIQNEIEMERQDLINYINSQGQNNQFYISANVEGILYEFTLSYGDFGGWVGLPLYDFQIGCKRIEENIEYYSYIWFNYNSFKNAEYYSKVTIEENMSYTMEFKGIELLDCPNITNPTSIERISSSNWDSSYNINDYTNNCYLVLKFGIEVAQQRINTYNKNLSLW